MKPNERQGRALYYHVLQLLHRMTSASNRVSEVPYTLAGGDDPGIVEDAIRDLIQTAKDIEEAMTPIDSPGKYSIDLHERKAQTPHHVTLDAALNAAMALTKTLSMPGRIVVPGMSAIKRADFSSFLGDATWPFVSPPPRRIHQRSS
jgi:hypothetical protein